MFHLAPPTLVHKHMSAFMMQKLLILASNQKEKKKRKVKAGGMNLDMVEVSKEVIRHKRRLNHYVIMHTYKIFSICQTMFSPLPYMLRTTGFTSWRPRKHVLQCIDKNKNISGIFYLYIFIPLQFYFIFFFCLWRNIRKKIFTNRVCWMTRGQGFTSIWPCIPLTTTLFISFYFIYLFETLYS